LRLTFIVPSNAGSRAEPVTGNRWAEWARSHKEAYYKEALKKVLAGVPESTRAINPSIVFKNFKDGPLRLAIDVPLRKNELESRLLALEIMPAAGPGRPVQFIPHRFEFTHHLTKKDKLLLAFDALVLSKAVGRGGCCPIVGWN
jgi:hypothetical protein